MCVGVGQEDVEEKVSGFISRSLYLDCNGKIGQEIRKGSWTDAG